MKMINYIKDKSYYFTEIENIDPEDDIQIEEFGHSVIGGNFLALQHSNGYFVSFILTDYNSKHGDVYTCIYTDFK